MALPAWMTQARCALPDGPRIGSLFSGVGGLDMGVAAVLGGGVAWHCEVDPVACRVLEHRFPGVPNLGDITTVDWSAVEPVDVLCGGFPCQDVSLAGKGAGLRDGTRSGLWAEFARAIDALRPSLVVVENVRGLLSAAAGRGPDAAPLPPDWTEHTYALPAGDSETDPDRDLGPDDEDVGDERVGPVLLRALGAVLGDLAELGYDARWCGLRAAGVGAPHGRYRVFVVAWPAADASSAGRESRDAQRADGGSADGRGRSAQPRGRSGATADPDRDGREGVRGLEHVGRDPDGCGGAGVAWGVYESAVRRWERLTRPVPMPWVLGKKGQRQLNPAFCEWMMGLPEGWVTEVPGVGRNDALRLLGNGVVPAQAAAALGVLLADGIPNEVAS